MAPPSKLNDPAVVSEVLVGLRLGMTYDLAARRAGIGKRTLMRWLSRGNDPEETDEKYLDFARRARRAEADAAGTALAVIHRAAKGGSWQAAAWLLERRHGYVRREQVEHSGEQTQRVIVIPAPAATPQEWAAQQAAVEEPARISDDDVDSDGG